MKFQTILAFENHLNKLPAGSPHLIAIVAPDFLERKLIVDKLLTILKKTIPSCDIVKLSFEIHNLQRLQEELTTSSLFSSNKIVLIKNLEKASKSSLDTLGNYLATSSYPDLVIEGEELKGESKFYEILKKWIVILDLTKEKPWERKERLLSWVDSYIKQQKKQTNKQTLDLLYERCHKDFSRMITEIDKLVCYLGEETHITSHHLNLIGSSSIDTNLWTLAENILWQDSLDVSALEEPMDTSTLHQLLGQLKYHCHVGMKMQDLIQQGVSEENLSSYFPQLSPKTASKYYKYAFKRSAGFFCKFLPLLCQSEIKLKSQNLPPQLMWTTLLTHIRELHNL